MCNLAGMLPPWLVQSSHTSPMMTTGPRTQPCRCVRGCNDSTSKRTLCPSRRNIYNAFQYFRHVQVRKAARSRTRMHGHTAAFACSNQACQVMLSVVEHFSNGRCAPQSILGCTTKRTDSGASPAGAVRPSTWKAPQNDTPTHCTTPLPFSASPAPPFPESTVAGTPESTVSGTPESTAFDVLMSTVSDTPEGAFMDV